MNEPIKHVEWLDILNMSLAKDVYMPINFYLVLLEGKARHISGGCINTYLRKSNMFNSFLGLQNLFSSSGFVNMLASWSSVPTLSIEMSPFCWWSLMKWWRTSMCFVLACWTGLLVSLIALSLSHSNDTFLNLISKLFKVAFIQRICAQQLLADMYSLWRLIMQHYFASLMTMKQVIFPTIDKCPKCFSFQPCIPHNQSPNIQLNQTLLLWDTTNQHFMYTSSTSIFSL